MVVLQLKNKHKFNVGQKLNWTVIFLEDIQLFWKFKVPITPWILKTVQKGTVTHSYLAIVANTFLLLKKQTDYTRKDQFQKTLSCNLGHLTLTIASGLCSHLNKKKNILRGLEPSAGIISICGSHCSLPYLLCPSPGQQCTVTVVPLRNFTWNIKEKFIEQITYWSKYVMCKIPKELKGFLLIQVFPNVC